MAELPRDKPEVLSWVLLVLMVVLFGGCVAMDLAGFNVDRIAESVESQP